MKKNLLTLLTSTIGLSLLQAQSFQNDVLATMPTPQELTMTCYKGDTTATALVLCDNVEVIYNDQQIPIYNHQWRIKILNESGLLSLSNHTPVAVYNMVNDSVTTNSIEEIRVGSIVDYAEQHVSSQYNRIEPWSPQREIPVLQATYTLYTPKGFNVQFERQGNAGVNMGSADTITINCDDNTKRRLVRRKMECRNIPAITSDDQIYCLEDYKFKMKPWIMEIENLDGSIETGKTTWENIDTELAKSDLIRRYNSIDDPIGHKADSLRKKGFKVLPVLLRSRSKGRTILEIPSAAAFDDIILAIIQPNDTLYVDPLKPDSISMLLDVEKRVYNARLLNYDPMGNYPCSGQWVNLFGVKEYSKISNINAYINISGEVNIEKSTYYRGLAMLEHGYKLDHENYTKQAIVTDTAIYISPYFTIEELIQKVDSNRVRPIEFNYCLRDRRNIIIEVDEALKIDSIPSNVYYISSTGAYAIRLTGKIYSDQKAEFSLIFERRTMIQLPSAHPYANNFFDILTTKCLEQMVIRRKEHKN